MSGRPYLTAALFVLCTLTGLLGMMVAGRAFDLLFLFVAALPWLIGAIALYRKFSKGSA